MDCEINHKKLNPLGFHLMKYLQDASIRFIILYGGSSSGKSYSVAQMILIYTLTDKENTLVLRKVRASVSKTIFKDFVAAAKQLGVYELFRFKEGKLQIECVENGAYIDFAGLDDPEKIKGISSYLRICLEEWSEFDEYDFKQIRKRMRGREGQQCITTFNPISMEHWIKQKVIDLEKWQPLSMRVQIDGCDVPEELTQVKSAQINSPKPMMNPRTGQIVEHAPDMVLLQTTYLNNFWVIGSPDGKYGYYDEQCIADFEHDRLTDPDYYNIYALGEWGIIRTGSEFFGSFNRGKHCKEVGYNKELSIHISVDNNVLPYISVSYWQFDGTTLTQIGETLGETPNNTVRKTGKLVAKYLTDLGCVDKVFLHGDASTRASNTIDENKRSFLDLLIDSLKEEGVEVEDCVGKKNPSVPMSGEFINAIFEGVLPDMAICIGDGCKTSIDDYMAVQKDANGAIYKTKVKNKTTMQTYEAHGHLSDTFRYVVCDVFKEQFALFSNKRKRNIYAKNGAVQFFNADGEYEYTNEVVYAMPYVRGKFVMVHGKQLGGKWHILDIAFRETSSTEEIKQTLVELHSERTVVECPQSYFAFIRELRKDLEGVRVMPETADLDRRIAATSDFVRNYVQFSEAKVETDSEYAQFLTNLFDYNKDNDNVESSAVLSGFVQFVAKSFSLE